MRVLSPKGESIRTTLYESLFNHHQNPSALLCWWEGRTYPFPTFFVQCRSKLRPNKIRIKSVNKFWGFKIFQVESCYNYLQNNHEGTIFQFLLLSTNTLLSKSPLRGRVFIFTSNLIPYQLLPFSVLNTLTVLWVPGSPNNLYRKEDSNASCHQIK